MNFLNLLITIYSLIIYIPPVLAQYSYIGDYTKEACDLIPPPGFYRGYTCSGDTVSCNTNLTFRSQSPYNTLSSIASLLGVDVNTVIQANPNYNTGIVEWNKLVYVPATCACHGGWIYYRKKITYLVEHNSTGYDIANNTFQGLTTCQALLDANDVYKNFYAGENISVRLRCACPTPSQENNGVKSLITYVVGNGDNISSISTQLSVDSKSIRDANDLEEADTIYPFTTLLIPVMNNNSTSERESSTLSKGAIGGIAAAACAALLAFGGVAIKFNLCGSIFSCFNCMNNITHYETKESKASAEPKPPKYYKMRDQKVNYNDRATV